MPVRVHKKSLALWREPRVICLMVIVIGGYTSTKISMPAKSRWPKDAVKPVFDFAAESNSAAKSNTDYTKSVNHEPISLNIQVWRRWRHRNPTKRYRNHARFPSINWR